MAVNELEKLLVVIEAQTGQFNTEINKVTNKISTMEKTTSKATASITKSFGAIAAVFTSIVSAGVILKFGKDMLSAADKLKTMSAQTGLGVERLQELQFAVSNTGGTADSMGRSIQTLSAAIESGNPALRKLGITTNDAGKAFDQVLNKLADMPESTERNVLGQQLLGKSFLDLKPLLAEGSAGIEKLTSSARKSGLIMSEGLVNSLDDLGDALGTLGDMIKSIFYPVIQGLIPLFQTLVSWLSIAAGFIRGVMEAIFGVPANSNDQIDASNKTTKTVISNAVKMKRAYAGFDELNVVPTATSAGASGSFDFGLGSLNTDLAKDIQNAKDQMELFNDAVNKGRKFWEDYGNAIVFATGALIAFWAAWSLGTWLVSLGLLNTNMTFLLGIYSKIAAINLADKFALWFASISTGGGVMQVFANIVQVVALALQKLVAVFGLTISITTATMVVIGAIIAVIAAFVLAIVDLWKTNYEFRKNLLDTWETIKDSFSRLYEAFIKPIIDNLIFWFGMIWELALKPLWNNFKEFVAGFVKLITAIWVAIKPIVDFLVGVFGPIFAAIFNVVIAVIGSVVIVVVNLFSIFFKIFAGIIKIVSKFVKEFGEGFALIANVVKAPINLVIDAINFLIKSLNKISFKAPDWLKFIGMGDIAGKTFGINIGLIPKLADGGMLNAGSMFIAGEAGAEMIGNYKGQTTVMPLENTSFVSAMKQAMVEGLTEALGTMSGGSTTLVVDGLTLAKAVENNLNKLSTVQGGLNIAF